MMSDPEASGSAYEPDEYGQEGPEQDTGPLVHAGNEDLPNLVPALMSSKKGQEALRVLSDKILDEIKDAVDASEPYRKKVASNWKLFSGDLPPKKFPFQDAANMHVPIAIENITRIVFHAYGELFGDWSNVLGVIPMGPEDDLTAQILSAHGNWQFRQQIPGFKRQQHRGLLSFFQVGDVTCHSFWDRYCGLNNHEILNTDEFITPFAFTTVRTDYGDLPWYARVLKKYKHELEAMADEWFDVKAVIEKSKPSWMEEPEFHLAEVLREVHGLSTSDSDKRAPYTLYWYEGWLELPGQERERFCKVIVDSSTKAVLSLSLLEQDNWQDRQRYELQMQEKQAFEAATAEHAQNEQNRQGAMVHLHNQAQQAQQMGDLQTYEQVIQELQQISSSPAPPPPTPPQWMLDTGGDPEPIKKEPVRMFSHGVCLEPLSGNLGLGYGPILADYNRAANTALSQFTDAASLANAQSLIVSDIVEFDGNFNVAPGRVNRVRVVSGAQLKENIMPMQFGGANQQLLEVVNNVRTYAQAAAQSPEVLSGTPGKSGETYRGLSARIEQATKVLSVTTRKYLEFFEQIAKNNAYLNSVFLRDEEIFMVANHALRGLPALATDPNAQPSNGAARVPGTPPPGAQPPGMDQAGPLPPGGNGLPPMAPGAGAPQPGPPTAGGPHGAPGVQPNPGNQPPGAPPGPGGTSPAAPEAQRMTPLKVTRHMYDRNYEVEFRCDLRFASEAQRINEADEVMNLVNNDKVFGMNLSMRYYVMKKALEARGHNDIVQLMGPPPPPGMVLGGPPGVSNAPPGTPGTPGPGGPPAGADNSKAPAPPNGGAPEPANKPV